MNEYLYNYLGGQGFTAEDYNDRIKQFLRATIIVNGGTPGVPGSIEDYWLQLASLLGATSTNVNTIQMEWALSRLSTGTTWNDLMRNLP